MAALPDSMDPQESISNVGMRIHYFTFDTLELVLRQAGLRPRGRWTNVAHFSVLGSSELVGRIRPGLGHTLISIASRDG